MRTRVKICGLTRAEDVATAVSCGVDAVGLVFYPSSPRAVTPAQAAALIHTVPPFVTVVGLFVDAEPVWVRTVLAQVPLGALQFHGHEPPDYCESFARPWIKAIAVRHTTAFDEVINRYAAAAGLLLDTYDPTLPGGTGRSFDWHLIPPAVANRCILAGGLTPDNVARAIQQVKPYAVDVSGGVESARGVKDCSKIAAFMQGVHDGDQFC
ncbi:phosphoribosylanthranilate isomerase [Thiospirillum jenense]|uniref:N-(5'-phosphoribosyl)anthranilate isomerase n=1 Tax=Thiospirillum jenense TaxID=1653858 RepID=A0A839HGI0_9GAMM|nr:phosphoribosylanthranilate isomerase [Thiospirillum jenense]MBB1127100.1 phosphoribosylanthranilate isomerase [Thiospirillum jenense]